MVGGKASDGGIFRLWPEFLYVGALALLISPPFAKYPEVEKGWIREKIKRNSLSCQAIFYTFNHLATCKSANGNLGDCNWNRH